jgi:zinc transport system ATP-binding protein
MLAVNDLTVAFGKRTIIDNLSFEIKPGDCLSILGPNGSGKTVLLRALLKLVAYKGEIRWTKGARLGYVPQTVAADRQLPMSMRDVLKAKTRFLKLSPSALDRVSSEVGMSSDILDANIGILSGGQFQKSLIAFALLGDPNVLLVDEPTASLDELTEERIYELLDSLHKSRGLTVILVSHDLSVIYRYSMVVLCLSKGKPCIGAPKEILTPQTLEELYSAPPKYFQHLHDHRTG